MKKLKLFSIGYQGKIYSCFIPADFEPDMIWIIEFLFSCGVYIVRGETITLG